VQSSAKDFPFYSDRNSNFDADKWAFGICNISSPIHAPETDGKVYINDSSSPDLCM